MISFRRNIRSLTPSQLSNEVLATLPPHNEFSSLSVNKDTDTLCSSLATSLNNLCPLTSKPARTTHPSPWLTEVIKEQRAELLAAERKWCKSRECTDLSDYQGLLASFSSSLKTAKTTYYQNKICSTTDAWKMFSVFNSLLNPPPPPPSTLLTADMFASFFTDKVSAISNQFTEPDQPSLQLPTNRATLSSFSPMTKEEVSKLLNSRPTTCPLDPIPSNLLQNISPALNSAVTHIINSSLTTGVFPTAFKQARVTPLLKKPTLNPAS
ncbi:uncharacterized protein LOC122968258 [Thunnus albacares]|uniref:uncharacterized protein LOC122968258 n=1 Tax=Thunnus albacares TaxID=8236 RepID=UPI001CF636F0|nr:uncharacterized protein LOC122968258 [Thunnus albacares]